MVWSLGIEVTTGNLYSISEKDGKAGSDERITQTGEDLGADLAQAGEIEVTERMIEAGEIELAGYDPGYDDMHETVERVIRAALGKRGLV